MLSIFIVILLLLLTFLGYAASKPDTFRIERSISINASPEKIFPLINNLKAWEAWSPYEKIDPAKQKIYSGPASGKSAVYAWSGNRHAGEGRVEITDVSPPTGITMALDMVKPFKASNIVDFSLEGTLAVTNVTWSMFGRQPFMGKVMSTIFNCDKMVGKQFHEGLTSLKALAEQ